MTSVHKAISAPGGKTGSAIPHNYPHSMRGPRGRGRETGRERTRVPFGMEGRYDRAGFDSPRRATGVR